ncbi:hypothetical protein IHQ71_24400 [Rhizobium sp. TH2]|uniref:hypothetical protein n=1 Tax=Rhizobium sp. TH2 TaxID=2775403 RepID=UPI0021585458|nr:hypothetical protein [Rhizobium sp. TH2]UVC08257.1 hypothetical protein IHQ71_24400 [Rhizobium sp. TH2]
MIGINHQDNPAVTEAAMWLSEHAVSPRPIIPILRENFSLFAEDGYVVCAATIRIDQGVFV